MKPEEYWCRHCDKQSYHDVYEVQDRVDNAPVDLDYYWCKKSKCYHLTSVKYDYRRS